MGWILVALLAAPPRARDQRRRVLRWPRCGETASTATLDARAGDYLTGALAFAAVTFVIFLSKLA